MKTQTTPRKHVHRLGASLRAGFSLVELLVVIAVIGIIAAIAIPNIGNVTGAATVAKAQRNAQNVASTFAAARAAGNTASYADAAAATTAVVSGITITDTASPFNGKAFKVPNLSSAEQTAAVAHLTLSATDGSGQLEYTP